MPSVKLLLKKWRENQKVLDQIYTGRSGGRGKTFENDTTFSAFL